MTTVLAVPENAAEWLHREKRTCHSLATALPSLVSEAQIRKGVLAPGTFRIAASPDGSVLVAWNTDYLKAGGEDRWGLVLLGGTYGLLSDPRIAPEVLERQCYVIATRLAGLLIEPELLWRVNDGVAGCIAGRGKTTGARANRILYIEGDVQAPLTAKVIACIGPDYETERMREHARSFFARAPSLANTANKVLLDSGRRPVLESSAYPDLSTTARPITTHAPKSVTGIFEVPRLEEIADADRRADLTYDDWVAPGSSLAPVQRRVLESDVIENQPLRIVGAAGSGKTLLMQLLATRRLRSARDEPQALRILYVVHNGAMEELIWSRFVQLGAGEFLEGAEQLLQVSTLLGYARSVLGADDLPLFDEDAQTTKSFQREFVRSALEETLELMSDTVGNSRIFSAARENPDIRSILVDEIADEIGIAIKAHGLGADARGYVQSERRLSRLHGLLDQAERRIVHATYRLYHDKVFEDLGVFDSDDAALSLLAKLNSPLWEMKRKRQGFDFVFVDEAQLFNENERRVFPLLTRGDTTHVSIVMAADEAQQARSTATAGLAVLGYGEMQRETLTTVHRSSPEILKLAFFVIQRTTDLFGPDFPDFTANTASEVSSSTKLSSTPMWISTPSQAARVGPQVASEVRRLRSRNLRSIAVVVHSERYWTDVHAAVVSAYPTAVLLERRGQQVPTKAPIVVLTRPDHVGGQEFDAVVCVGLEQGVVPPRVDANAVLSASLEQQALRHMYVAFTRARYQVVIVGAPNSTATRVLQEARRAEVLVDGSPA